MAKIRGKFDTNLARFPTMESLSVFAHEGKDIITAVSTPTKGSRRLATASMIFEKLNSPRKFLCKEKKSDHEDGSQSNFPGSPKDDMKPKCSTKSLKDCKNFTVSVPKQFSMTGVAGIGLLLCTHEMGFQVIGITGESAAKELLVIYPNPAMPKQILVKEMITNRHPSSGHYLRFLYLRSVACLRCCSHSLSVRFDNRSRHSRLRRPQHF